MFRQVVIIAVRAHVQDAAVMEMLWIGSSFVDERVQLVPELVAQAVTDAVVVAQNP
jgi:hypothetical protein